MTPNLICPHLPQRLPETLNPSRAGTTLTGDHPGPAPHWAAVVTDGELSAGSQANPPSPVLEGDLLVEVRDALTTHDAARRPNLPASIFMCMPGKPAIRFLG